MRWREEGGGRRGRGEEEERGATLLKTRTQHHRMVVNNGCEHIRFLYVFVTSDLEILSKLVVLEKSPHAPAAEHACGLYCIL